MASCTKDGVRVALAPGDCAPIPACNSAGYFTSDWRLLVSSGSPDWLSIKYLSDVANFCATTAALPGPDFVGDVTAENPVTGEHNRTSLTVHIRSESSMHVELAIDGAPVANGRTLVGANQPASLSATAVVGSFTDRTGTWALLTANSTFEVMTAASGRGSLMSPTASQNADLVLQLNAPGTSTPGDDVFSLPVRVMSNGDAAVILRQVQSSYHGVPCAGMTQIPNCDGEILCFSAADSILSWPSGSDSSGRTLVFTHEPVTAEFAKDGPLFAGCSGQLTSVTGAIESSSTRLDESTLSVH